MTTAATLDTKAWEMAKAQLPQEPVWSSKVAQLAVEILKQLKEEK
jgi:hypothetical protein